MTEIITIAEDHSVSYSSGAFVLNLTIDNQNAVDRIEFVLPESVGNPADWAWRVEISQNGETSWVALADDVVWVPRAGAVTYGKCELQLVGVQPAEDGSYNRVWKSRMFKANVLESINAIVDAEQASALDDIVLKVEGYKDAAEASAQAAASSASAAQAAQTEAESAQDAAEDAQSAAETAQGKAEAAQTAAETAQTGAETARTQAQAAQNAAETAQGKAEDAQEAAEAAQAAAEGAAEDLAEAVASAAQSASSAAQSATDASGYASAASSSATAAAGSATTAQGHASAAQTARAGAESAQSAAETAQGLAEDAQEAAETARNAAQSAQSAAESAKSGAETAKSDAETAKTAAETAAGNASDDADAAASSASAAAQSAETAQAAAQTALGIIDDEVISGDSTWSSEMLASQMFSTAEHTGNPVQFTARQAGMPIVVRVSWGPGQEGEGDPSLENVRPITGLDEVTVTLSDGTSDGTTATLSLPSTVYGGEVDYAIGAYFETHVCVDMGTLRWELINNAFSALAPINCKNMGTDEVYRPICTIFPSSGTGARVVITSGGYIQVYNAIGIFTSVEDFVSGVTGQSIVYEVKYPIKHDAELMGIKALPGENVLITNADDLTVTEYASPKPIEDTAVTDDHPWSSKQIIDALCPPLEETGNPVQCYPVAGYPLGVKASWEPRQSGEGDPSPENIRPITGLDEVTVTLSDGVSDGTTATLTLPETIYGGTVDAVTGEGSEEWEVVEFDGTENWATWGVDNFTIGLTGFYFYVEILPVADSADYLACSHLVYNSESYGGRAVGFRISLRGDKYWILTVPNEILSNTESSTAAIDSWKSYLAAQYAAGTPVTIAYKLVTPTAFQATGSQSLPALSGQNVLITNADSLTVTGRADPNHTIQTLSDRIAALESETIEGGTNA